MSFRYYRGARHHPVVKVFLEVTQKIEEGRHTPIIIEEFVTEFCKGIETFESDFKIKLSSDDRWLRRVGEILELRQII